MRGFDVKKSKGGNLWHCSRCNGLPLSYKGGGLSLFEGSGFGRTKCCRFVGRALSLSLSLCVLCTILKGSLCSRRKPVSSWPKAPWYVCVRVWVGVCFVERTTLLVDEPGCILLTLIYSFWLFGSIASRFGFSSLRLFLRNWFPALPVNCATRFLPRTYTLAIQLPVTD